ncbi:MAG: HigA family addiction module antidote protein [Bacteroidales bacterium]|nr:HigA family addiction module antidote protein [Candidatus Colicola equi]
MSRSSYYEEYWKEKKRLRRDDDTPITPIDELMKRLGIPAEMSMTQERPVSPGALIQAVLDDLQFTQSELAQQMGVTRTAIHLWIHGQRALSVENALSLQFYLGIPAHILLRLQADYMVFAAQHPGFDVDQVPRHSTM